MIMKIGELWIHQLWTHIPKWSYERQYSWVRLANNLSGWQIIFKKISKLKMDTSLNKANQELLCRKYLVLVAMCMC
jgi:hypothetical protein